jgi:hypothetical protein
MEISEIAMRTLTNPMLSAEASWTEPWRRAEIPAANGHGNARSVATIQAAVANGGEVGGVRLLSAAGCERILLEQAHGPDLVLGVPIRLGVGYGLPSPELPISSTIGPALGRMGGSVIRDSHGFRGRDVRRLHDEQDGRRARRRRARHRAGHRLFYEWRLGR